MPKVNFKSYQTPTKPALPSQLEIIAAKFGAYLTVDQFAECIGIRKTLAYGLVRGGALKASRTSGKHCSYRISATEVIRYMENTAK